jgi:peptidoglycan hydrolase-like protein with peptidoglycan-binding domain
MNNRIYWASAIVSVAVLVTPSLAFASFDQNLRLGDRGQEVVSLQQFLIAQGLLATNNDSGFFGNLTILAVKKFQSRTGIASMTGFFGPLTRAKANAIVNNKPSVEFTASASPDYRSGGYVYFSAFAATPVRRLSGYIVDFGDGSTESMEMECHFNNYNTHTPCYENKVIADHAYVAGSYRATLIHDGGVVATLLIVVTQDQVYITE